MQRSSLEALQMQLKEIDAKLDILLCELKSRSKQLLSLQDVAEILRLSYSGVYKRAVIDKRLEPDKEIFLRSGKWFVSMSALNKLRTSVW
ncbi:MULTISPECIES: hypothetical protein [unclassified Campylobacter]|uniref:hypothetical protein n=1 Tax=unclassified Campylobacter TaxID=2593542 RepID=UPI003D337B0F